ncbi:methylmalonyl-CoA mutase family protein [Ekhidna sp.]
MKNLNLNIFPQTSKDEWLQLAENQLKGANPATELAWENDANINLNGYYDHSDILHLKYLEDFFSNVQPHKWKLYERIISSNPEVANEQALKALMGGCDGIILSSSSNMEVLLKDINSEICEISFDSSASPISVASFTGFQLFENGNCASSDVTKNPIDQLCELFQKLKNHTYVHRIAVSDFFLEIASVRALRYLLDNRGFKGVHIHSQIPQHEEDDHQWFLNTTSGLASILGGSHSIDLTTASGDSRISRNTGNLIREESGIEEYGDQCGGSYYIEFLTDKIINQVSERLK